ncbi:MAG: type II toxin-antitoxin system HicA family toxin [Alphaproteobacteria bacterium]
MASSREVIARLKSLGWRQVRQRGSHVRMTSPDGTRHVTVPHPKKDLKPGTLASIEKDTGVKFD